jgi:uncharacterized protein
VLPLHIPEPRYRRMTAEALDGTGLIAMALFAGQVSQTEYLKGRPKLRPTVCIGYIERYERLEDGRYLILLRGLCRARIVEELEYEAYRLAKMQPIGWPPARDTALSDARGELQAKLEDPGLVSVRGLREVRKLFEGQLPTEALVDLVIAAVNDDVESRYRMLCETNSRARAQWAIDKLDEMSGEPEG